MIPANEPVLDWNRRPDRTPRDIAPRATRDPRWDGSATPKQIAFLQSLAEQTGHSIDEELAKGSGPSKARASALIERLLELKRSAPTPRAKQEPKQGTAQGLDLSALAGGRYAATVDGVTKFFRIDRVKEGRWEGWTFVKLQASDDLHRQGSQKPGGTYRGTSASYLREILRDEQAAFELYGKELGRCGVCGRTLTDEESRERGIGPVCLEKMGW